MSFEIKINFLYVLSDWFGLMCLKLKIEFNLKKQKRLKLKFENISSQDKQNIQIQKTGTVKRGNYEFKFANSPDRDFAKNLKLHSKFFVPYITVLERLLKISHKFYFKKLSFAVIYNQSLIQFFVF